MNLELLDPFRRQIPDRVDSTLARPEVLSSSASKKSGDEDDKQEKGKDSSKKDVDDVDKGAYHVAFNRRGTYLAVGYAGGTVAVHDFMSRTLSALYRPPDATMISSSASDDNDDDDDEEEQKDTPDAPVTFPYGVTSVTWSRRSKTLLAGAVGDSQIRLFDTTHPLGPDDCFSPTTQPNEDTDAQKGSGDDAAPPTSSKKKAPSPSAVTSVINDNEDSEKEIAKAKKNYVVSSSRGDEMMRQPRVLHNVQEVSFSSNPSSGPGDMDVDNSAAAMRERHEAALQKMREADARSATPHRLKRFATLLWKMKEPLGGSLQVHPRRSTCGLAVMQSGALVVFYVPPTAWESFFASLETKPIVKFATLYNDEEHKVTCAAFDPNGEKIYAATKDGIMIGFENMSRLFKDLEHNASQMKPIHPKFEIGIPSNAATVWHLQVSRNGKFVLLNCADSALRLYDTSECWSQSQKRPNVKPTFCFQDVVSKVPFASCDFSGDGEYVVGGCNGSRDDKYELYIWNTATGTLMDRLMGAQVSLYSVTWHPTRSFLAVATSDGLIDIWGPRMDWTAFAPDFQALPMNVEYVEEEDEFDNVVQDKPVSAEQTTDIDVMQQDQPMDESDEVDVVTVEPVPVFASDSESESEVFYFGTKIKATMVARGRPSGLSSGKAAVVEDKEP